MLSNQCYQINAVYRTNLPVTNRKNYDAFLPACEMKSGDEHSLEYHAIYREYLRTFEGKIEGVNAFNQSQQTLNPKLQQASWKGSVLR